MSSAEATFDKGDRVEIVRGRQGVGAKGQVFWKGPNKYGPGDRLGVRGDDGQTWWVTSGDVVATASKPDLSPGPSFDRGARVRFTRDGVQLHGEVFWTGQSRNGPGQRLGVRVDGEEEATWIDARLVQADDGPAPAARPSRSADEDDLHDEVPADWASSVGMDELPPAPPIDDAFIDAYDWEPDED